jgi:hypothetical protein
MNIFKKNLKKKKNLVLKNETFFEFVILDIYFCPFLEYPDIL